MVQCESCRELFTVSAVVSGNRIVSYDEHPHINRQNGIKTRHICGGDLQFFGLKQSYLFNKIESKPLTFSTI